MAAMLGIAATVGGHDGAPSRTNYAVVDDVTNNLSVYRLPASP
jgi:hypothetical protein